MTSADWLAATDEWMILAHEAGKAANRDGADAIQRETRATLRRRWHPPQTRTPSAPGEPPASISGGLALSVLTFDEGDSAVVGPTAIYAHIQEEGGGMQGHPMMRWKEDGQWHESRYHRLPERPYFRPSSDHVIDSGELEEIYARHWLEAERAVTR